MSPEPEDLVLLLREMRADVAADFIDVRREVAGVRRKLGERIVGLRRAVVEYPPPRSATASS